MRNASRKRRIGGGGHPHGCGREGGGGEEGYLCCQYPQPRRSFLPPCGRVPVPWTGVVCHGTNDADTAHGVQLFDMYSVATTTSNTAHTQQQVGAWVRSDVVHAWMCVELVCVYPHTYACLCARYVCSVCVSMRTTCVSRRAHACRSVRGCQCMYAPVFLAIGRVTICEFLSPQYELQVAALPIDVLARCNFARVAEQLRRSLQCTSPNLWLPTCDGPCALMSNRSWQSHSFFVDGIACGGQGYGKRAAPLVQVQRRCHAVGAAESHHRLPP